jgi:FixJ family two-component response regulator
MNGQGEIMSLAHVPSHESLLSAVPFDTPTVFVVDDDTSIQQSLAMLIRCEGWRVETFSSAPEFLARPRTNVPNCLILDLLLPELDGIELQKRLAVERPEMPIVFVTGCGDIPTTVMAMKAGALEFLTKPFDSDVLLNAVREGFARSRVVLERETKMRELRNRYSLLTPRERQVMSLVASGLLNKQVAAELGISEITVKAHRGQLMRKMKAESFADLVRMVDRFHLKRPVTTFNSPQLAV